MRIKINYRIDESYLMKKLEMCYLQSLEKFNKTENLIHNKKKS